MALNLYTIPPGEPFLEALARGWLAERGGDPMAIADGLILTPTRRAARALAEAFLRVSPEHGLLLPRIVALGAVDEAPLALAGALELPPAVDSYRRLAILTGLILRMNGAGGAPRTADQAWLLAAELANLMDEADRAEIDLAARLPDAADPAFAAHWSRTLEFLRIVTHAWPEWLAENGVMNPAARQVALLNAQAAAWQAEPPAHEVLIAGTTAGIPAVARLAGVVARLPLGGVVLPVLDTLMTPEAWAAMEDSHPQAGLASLLAGLNATREDVRPWGGSLAGHSANLGHPADLGHSRAQFGDDQGRGQGWEGSAARFALLSRALLPAAALDAWQDTPQPATRGIWRLKPRDPQEEAEAIAMILRQAAETPGRTAALVTPDRDLAVRVSAALPRHGIIADDSAGENLTDTPPAVFLRLLARAVTEALAPVPLLALLKHPLAAAGLPPATCRRLARALELAALRGPRPLGGVAGMRLAIKAAGAELNAFWSRVEACLEPVLRVEASVEIAPAAALAGLLAAAENLAATGLEAGIARLWAGEEGEALSTALSAALEAMPNLPDQRGGVMPGLLDALLDGQVVRTRRALRGRDGTEHHRVFIWGPLEARLQSVDVIILGGLTETVWPPAPEPGPWLSRPMRASVGLPSPEAAIGLSAHDFLAAAMAAPEVILSCPDRRDGAPAVPARWLTRLDALLAGAGVAARLHPAAVWARCQDVPAGGPKPVQPPRPCPPVALRPSRLSVTEIETWRRDPYAIYAKHILRLPSLDELDQETDAADFGSVVHAGLHIFFREHGTGWPRGDAALALRGALRRALAETYARPALTAWWEPRLDRIADWVAETEWARRSTGLRLESVETEKPGRIEIRRPTRQFTLVARADRIDRRPDGTLAIFDYKSGMPPSEAEVKSGFAPQLPLEAMIAAAGGFGPRSAGQATELIYWRLSGGYVPGKACPLKDDTLATAIPEAPEGLARLIDQYDEPGRAYLAHPDPARRPRFPEYAQLARVAEWLPAVEDGDGEA